MLRLYRLLCTKLGELTSRHEKTIFTTGARMLALICLLIAAYFARDCSHTLFG